MTGSVARFAKVGCGPHNTGPAQVFAVGVDNQARNTPLPWGNQVASRAACARRSMTVVILANAWRGKHDKRARKSALMRGEGNVIAFFRAGVTPKNPRQAGVSSPYHLIANTWQLAAKS